MSRGKITVGASSFSIQESAPLVCLEEAGYEVVSNPFGRRLTEAETTQHIQGAMGHLAGLEPLSRAVLEASCGHLRAIARIGIGMDNIDQEAAHEFGISVSNTPDAPTRAVAEMTLAACLALLRGLVDGNRLVHERQWPKSVGWSLRDLPVLFIGYGRIGRETARLFRALGARILVSDPYVKPEFLQDGEERTDLAEGMARCRIVSLHAAGKTEILGQAELSLLPEKSFLLNSARGGLVNEAAVLEELHSGRLEGVWFDTFWQEPYTGPLCDEPKALLTSHYGTYTRQCRLSMEGEAVANLIRDLEGVS